MFGLGPDGSVYIGDYNLVRRLYPDGRLATVLQFKSKQVTNCTAKREVVKQLVKSILLCA